MKVRTEIYECPVDGCEWALRHDDMPGPGPYRVRTDAPIDQALNEAINESASANARWVDGKLRAHFESHDVLDWVRTVQRLNQDLYQQHSGIRPHVYDNYRAGADAGVVSRAYVGE